MQSRPMVAALVLAFVASGCSSSSSSPPITTGATPTPGISPSPSPTPTASPPPGTNYVTPKFTFAAPAGLASVPGPGLHPAYVSPASKGVTITLVSSSAGPSGLSASTDLTAPGVCVAGTCTVNGPPVPPGTDVIHIAVYDAPPTGTPPVEPAGANVLSQSNSTASPAMADPSLTIVAGTNNTIAVLLYGVPEVLALSGTGTFSANAASSLALTPAVLDHANNPIGGQFSAPVTVTDSDTNPLGSTLTLTNATTGTSSVALNTSADEANLKVAYNGLAETAPAFTATAPGGVTSAAVKPFTVSLNPIALTPGETDLYATSGTGSSGQFTASELGWSNAPYNQTFTIGTATCSSGTAATVFSLSVSHLTYTDTAPASPAAGSCTQTINDFAGGQSASETLTYTAGSFTIDTRPRR